MTVICPKCSLVRPPDATNPDWQCPGCGICYAKFQDRSAELVRPAYVAAVEVKHNWNLATPLKIALLVAFGWGLNTYFERRQEATVAEFEAAAVMEQEEPGSGVVVANKILEASGMDSSLLHKMAPGLEQKCAAGNNKYGLSPSECSARVRERADGCATDTAQQYPGKISDVDRMQEVTESFVACVFEE